MPWDKRETKNGNWQVYSTETGEKVGKPHDTKQEATQHVKALYANAGPEAKRRSGKKDKGRASRGRAKKRGRNGKA